MHASTFPVLAVLACLVPLTAQDSAPQPSPKLEAFAPFVGHWTGSGTVVPEEDGAAVEWTATVEFAPVLGGFFFQDDTVVEMVGMPTPLVMRTVYGWDAENERYVAYGIGNTGEAQLTRVHFPKPGTMVMAGSGMRFGQLTLGRTVWMAKGDSTSFRSERANDAGSWYTEVQGRMQRVETAPKPAPAEASFMDMPVPEPIEKLLDAMAGTYGVAGAMTMAPGMPEMKVRGTERIGAAFGGHALHSRVEGYADNDEVLYVGDTYMTWNEVDRCYDLVMFDNMGAVAKAQNRFAEDGSLVGVFSGPMMGQLTVQRSVTKFGERGVQEIYGHTISGTHPPMETFRMHYTRKAD
jgi:hypothetical protein